MYARPVKCFIYIDKCVSTLYRFILNPIQKSYEYIIICMSLLFLNTLNILPQNCMNIILYHYLLFLTTINCYNACTVQTANGFGVIF